MQLNGPPPRPEPPKLDKPRYRIVLHMQHDPVPRESHRPAVPLRICSDYFILKSQRETGRRARDQKVVCSGCAFF